jgi:cysteine desulfurase
MIYLDNSATTKIDPQVVKEMIPYLEEYYGNPSSLYHHGQISRRVIDRSREIISQYIGSDIQEIIFTSGGTESNNLAIRGVSLALKNKGRHIITTEIEHDSVMNTIKNLEGFNITYLKPDKNGVISEEDLDKEIQDNTILVSIIYANSEIGTIQNIKALSNIAHKKGILFHTDAMQAAKYLDINVENLGVDLMTFGAHKINGPKGIGALYIKRETPIKPYLFGGSQEYNMRAGTENVAGIVGFGKAIEILSHNIYKRIEKVKNLRDKFENTLKDIGNIKFNSTAKNRMPHLTNVYFKNILSESMLVQLDLNNIAASAGSACSSLSIEPSHVLKAIGLTDYEAKHSIRFSLGHENTLEEIEKTIQIIKKINENYS